MRILPFDPYGALPPQGVNKDPHSNIPLNQKISDEIAKNEAMRLALLAITDQEKDKRKRKHRFKILNRKQAKVLLSQLRNVDLDFQSLKNAGLKEEEDNEEDNEESSKQGKTFHIASSKKPVKIGASAAQAIADAAEAWVIARNRGVLDMASLLFWHKDDEC
ncbi:hypothetical protein [Chlamydia caviae]|uniref:Uncharacterized protein n=1 Tax=Chlamydia caviae (strain ATCC VR-813 / DSM 19441 / 03DC25 / GPIC) TaxID=227941 RepID=Q823F8_CHLCV|nr:hypothetical protein [Chlamydia caviae]AAP05198.1 conserved hypothetical protein [Chlamydia caviae GPIC]